MKVFIASALLLVGSCATIRHSEKVENLKNSIEFKDKNLVNTYLETITPDELKTIVYEISSDKYEGRLTGEQGHNNVCDYIRNYYKSQGIGAPKSHPNYYQEVPKDVLPKDINASQNVIAYVKGSKLPNEYIYITAHTDHEGIVDEIIYPGADDNGSGTAAIFEIAEAFKKAADEGYPPKRSIVFLHVTGEEIGLYGSRYYTEHPIFPIENTVSNINIDMIGRTDKKHTDEDDYIYVIGSDRVSTEFDYIIQKANKQFTQLDLDYTYNDPNEPNRYFYRSDHYNFAVKDIPVVFFFNGEHEDYTKPTDTADKINYQLLAKRTKLIFATTWYLANSETKLSRIVL